MTAEISFEPAQVLNAPGLTGAARSEWPRVAAQVRERPIMALKPGSEAHDRVKSYILKRLRHSERAMSDFYARWQVNEYKMQAYINLPDWEKELQELNDKGEIPRITRIQIPYSFATLSTITTFLMHAFTGRRPMFQVSSWKNETLDASLMMEQKLQYDADHTKLTSHFWRFLMDSQQYGLGIFRCLWAKDEKLRTIRRNKQMLTLEGGATSARVPQRELHTVYEGNMIAAQDPYMFFPDPRVPMSEVNSRGEYVFWRSFEGRHALKRMEAEGILMWVDDAQRSPPRNDHAVNSARNIRFGGTSHAGTDSPTEGIRGEDADFVQVDQGTIDLIPRELGIGDSESPEKWIFTILNKSQIVQAEPFDADHGLHPVAVCEPYTMGYTFGQPGMSDYLNPIQDGMSWFFNSHIDNVRKVLNDMLIVDPSMIEMKDLKNPEPGKLIRLKQAAFGMDVRMAVHQLDVRDVTAGHVEDGEQLGRIGQFVSSISENLMGQQQTSSGRKTATEVRSAGEAAASRLAGQARIISSQAVTDLTKMMSINNQQYLSEEFFIQLLGNEAREKPLRITPEQLTGDFYYPVNDGTLPIDRVAMMDVWREIFQVLVADPELRQRYDIGEVFEHIAELGGAKNIERFERAPGQVQPQIVPDEQVQNDVQAGNSVPIAATGGSPAANRIRGQL